MSNDVEEEISNSTERLIPFLRSLADSIENKELLSPQLQKIGEFFMAYKFHEQVIKDNECGNENDNKEVDNKDKRDNEDGDVGVVNDRIMSDCDGGFSKEEMVKFICLGWYVYKCLLNNERIN